MPAAFDACIKGGGRVITKKLSGNRYIHICFPRGGGPSVAGEVKTAQKSEGEKYMNWLEKETDKEIKKQEIPLVSEMLEIMDTMDLRVSKLDHYGETRIGKNIKVNTKFGDTLNTIVHEILHNKYPEKSEQEIWDLSAVVESRLSMRDQAKLLENYESNISRGSDRALLYNLAPMKAKKNMSVLAFRNKYSKIK